MAEVVKKQFKSKYHILIWIAVLSLIFMGMVEYGYVTGGRSFGNWKVHLGLIPYVAWLVLTYILQQNQNGLSNDIIQKKCLKFIAS